MLIDEVKKQNKPYGLYFRDITGGFTTTQRAGLQAFKVIPVMVYRVYAGRPSGRTGARRRHRGHAARELLQDPGDQRQAGSFQRILRRRDRAACRSRAVAPAILVSEIEIEKKAKSNDRPPLLPEPTSMENIREARDEAAVR